MTPVRRCSLTPKNFGRSPGAADLDSRDKERTWLIESTVAATNHGNPSSEATPICRAKMKRSRW